MHNRLQVTAAFLIALALIGSGCGESDPKKAALQEGMDMARSCVERGSIRDAAKRIDPDLKPSTVVATIFGEGSRELPPPPKDIGFTPEEKPTKAWCIVFKPDDAARAVILEGYGDDLARPLKTDRVDVAKP